MEKKVEKVEPALQPGFHSHGHTAPHNTHHAKPDKKKPASADDMLAADLLNLPKGGVHDHHPHPKKEGQPKAVAH